MIELSLREVQKISLNILKIVDDICRQEGLTYCLFYGTLIGAIRHNGFIPWDDDIDIAMPRNDYDKLKKYFIKHKDNLMPYVYFDPDTNENYPYMLARICDIRFKIETENEYDFGMGCFIDIYPMDIVSSNKCKRFFVTFIARFQTGLFVIKSKKKLIKNGCGIIQFYNMCCIFLAYFFQKKTYMTDR